MRNRDAFARTLSRLLRSQVDILDRQVPVRFENLKSSLFFLLIRFLVWIKLLDESGCIEIVVRDGRILERDRYAVGQRPPSVEWNRGLTARTSRILPTSISSAVQDSEHHA